MNAETNERERIKKLLKKHWKVCHPNYPSKMAYLFALIDGKQAEEDGCGNECRVSRLTDEVFICGESKLNGKTWLCDDCLNKEEETNTH